jgi:hyaluronoglucosaminidase
MLEAQKGSLRKVRIYDYANTQYRGVIEGYYGVPYSKEVTEDLFRFMARYKMNTYMYGAKSDPYHSRYWEKPYPTSITQKEKELGYLSQDMLRSMTDVAHQCKVNFNLGHTSRTSLHRRYPGRRARQGHVEVCRHAPTRRAPVWCLRR